MLKLTALAHYGKHLPDSERFLSGAWDPEVFHGALFNISFEKCVVEALDFT